MKLIRGLHNLRKQHRGCVVSIGNFDGFHRGHQALVARLRAQALRTGQPVAVMVFEPTPREYFAPEQAPGRIATFRDKLCHLENAGVERLVCARFGAALAAMPAERFVEEVLVARLGARAVIVGDDFRFGAKRAGDLALLRALGARHGFVAEGLETIGDCGARVSSTAVRQALAVPDLARVAELLGRPYSLRGRVRAGLRLARQLGMPTLNVAMRRPPALRHGVYVVRVHAGLRVWDGVASIGVRPTLAQPSACLLEAHLFGANEDLYGTLVEVEFRKFLRAEERFESLEALAAQMQRDGVAAQAWIDEA